ncbi:MAG: chemotaxis protein CheC, partial [Actinomycetia bacterium]|nr:chemotaxis protein CheC [Actinomycetes bacterium]
LLLFGLSGDIGGTLFLKLSMNSAREILTQMLRKNCYEKEEFSEIDISAFKSIGNILCSSFINVLADMAKLKVLISPPAFAHDYAGSILDQILMIQGETSDRVLLVKIDLLEPDGHKFDAEIFYIPQDGDLRKMLKSLTKKEGFFSKIFG